MADIIPVQSQPNMISDELRKPGEPPSFSHRPKPTPQGGGGAKGQEVAFPESRLDGSMSRDRAMAQSTWRATPKFSTCQDAHLNGVFLFVLLERLEELDHFGTGPLKSNTEVY